MRTTGLQTLKLRARRSRFADPNVQLSIVYLGLPSLSLIRQLLTPICILSLLLTSLFAALPPPQSIKINLAAGMKYTLDPAPNYALCTDPGDMEQLTDGFQVKGRLWAQTGAVGWQNQPVVTITVDLGRDDRIGGASFSSAAGIAGVEWPVGITILASSDGSKWTLLGDLVALSLRASAPTNSGYSTHRFQTTNLVGRGRFVRFVTVQSSAFTFVDEIEVFPVASGVALETGASLLYDSKLVDRIRIESCLRRRLRNDLDEVIRQLDAARLEAGVLVPLRAEVDAISQLIPSTAVEDPVTFNTVFPINELHRRIFRLQASLWRARGLRGIAIWKSHRYDPISPTELPRSADVSLGVEMMSNEYRADVLNLSNASDQEIVLHIEFRNLPGGQNPEYVQAFAVPFTDTLSGAPVAAALVPLELDGGQLITRLAPGLTRQVWFTFHPTQIPSGLYQGQLVLQSAGLPVHELPVLLKIFPFQMSAKPALHLSGWDYSDGERFGEVTSENRQMFVTLLREYFVDPPWGRTAVLARGRHDRTGKMIQPPDPSRFHAWVEQWPDASFYCIFANLAETFEGFLIGTPEFELAVSQWIDWWSNKVKEWSITPDQIVILLVDEPNSAAADKVIAAYAKIVHAVSPRIRIWENPVWSDPSNNALKTFDVSDVICPKLTMWISKEASFQEFFLKQQTSGKRLWFYAAEDQSRLLDPYAHYRLQHWFCWQYGAEGSAFWSFGDSGGASSWNEYLTRRGAFSPLFLDRSTIIRGKHMEAIREGLEDYETLRLFRDLISNANPTVVQPGLLAAARQLLESAPTGVTDVTRSAAPAYWNQPRDRGLADRVRIKILETMSALRNQ